MDKSFYTTLKTELGASDAINEYVEVLLRKCEAESFDENTFQQYAVAYGIRVNDISSKEALLSIRRHYIVCVSQHFEFFLKSFQNHLKKYATTYRAKVDGESLLECVCSTILDLSNTASDSYLLYLLCDYYRLVRNHCAHIGDTAKISLVITELKTRTIDIRRLFPKLNAPSCFEEISFDDFILYSRAVKKLAALLVEKAEYNVDNILADVDFKAFMKHKNDPIRLHSALLNGITCRFPMSNTQIELVVAKIEKML